MAQSFSAAHQLSDTPHVRRKVLVTGGAGNIGSYFLEHAHDRYDMRAMVLQNHAKEREIVSKLTQDIVEADVTDLASLKQACEGMDTVLHLAADPSPSAT